MKHKSAEETCLKHRWVTIANTTISSGTDVCFQLKHHHHHRRNPFQTKISHGSECCLSTAELVHPGQWHDSLTYAANLWLSTHHEPLQSSCWKDPRDIPWQAVLQRHNCSHRQSPAGLKDNRCLEGRKRKWIALPVEASEPCVGGSCVLSILFKNKSQLLTDWIYSFITPSVL